MKQHHGLLRLIFAALAGAFIWLVVLPWIATWEPVQARIERDQDAGIDPSAMFYTDLEHLNFKGGLLRRDPAR